MGLEEASWNGSISKLFQKRGKQGLGGRNSSSCYEGNSTSVGMELNQDLGVVGRLEWLMQTDETLAWKSEDDRS